MNRRNAQRQFEIVRIFTPVKYVVHIGICWYLLHSKFYPNEYGVIAISLVNLWMNSTNLQIDWQKYNENEHGILITEGRLLENAETLDHILSTKEMFDIGNKRAWILSSIKMNKRLAEEECNRGVKRSCQKMGKELSMTDDELIKDFEMSDFKEITKQIKTDEKKAVKEKKKLEEDLEFYHDERLELNDDFWKLIYNMMIEFLILSSNLILLFIELLFTFRGSSKMKFFIFVLVFLGSTVYLSKWQNDDVERTKRDINSSRHEKLPDGKIKVTLDDLLSANMKVSMTILVEHSPAQPRECSFLPKQLMQTNN